MPEPYSKNNVIETYEHAGETVNMEGAGWFNQSCRQHLFARLSHAEAGNFLFTKNLVAGKRRKNAAQVKHPGGMFQYACSDKSHFELWTPRQSGRCQSNFTGQYGCSTNVIKDGTNVIICGEADKLIKIILLFSLRPSTPHTISIPAHR